MLGRIQGRGFGYTFIPDYILGGGSVGVVVGVVVAVIFVLSVILLIVIIFCIMMKRRSKYSYK